MTQYITTSFSGRLANVSFMVLNAFRVADAYGAGRSIVVLDGGYAFPGENEAITHGREEFFHNALPAFVDHSSYMSLISENPPENVGTLEHAVETLSRGKPVRVRWPLPRTDEDMDRARTLFVSDSLRKRVSDLLQDIPRPIGECVCLHNRAGDFRTFRDGKYMQTAESLAKSLSGVPCGTPVVVCSDEPDYTLSLLKGREFVYKSPGTTDIEDLVIMSMSMRVVPTHHSSFSYLGMVLNKNTTASGFVNELKSAGLAPSDISSWKCV